MANNGNYTVTIRLVDDTTNALKNLNKKLTAMQRPFKRLSAEWGKFSKLTGLSRITSGLNSLTTSALKAGVAVAGLGSVTSIAGIFALAQAFANAGMRLQNFAQGIGTSASQLVKWENAGRLAGVAAGTVDG